MAQTAFGPMGPNFSLVRPGFDPNASSGVDTWFKNCSAAGSKDGTFATADFFNVIVANLRTIVRNANIPLDGTNDLMVYQAVQAIAAQIVADAIRGISQGGSGASYSASQGVGITSGDIRLAVPGLVEELNLGFPDQFPFFDVSANIHRRVPFNTLVSAVLALVPSTLPSISPPRNIAVFGTPGSFSWPVPDKVTWIFRDIVGGGGGAGGGNGSSSTTTGGGGGAGGTAQGWVQVTPGQVITGFVGGGGLGSAANAGLAGGGSSTSVQELTATGGQAGSNAAGGPGGGLGGMGVGGQRNIYGGNGGDGSGSLQTPGGAGGASSRGGGGRTSTVKVSASQGRAAGSGGGGIWGSGAAAQNGGDGAAGEVVFLY